jgi:hydroxymethylbilane synthase
VWIETRGDLDLTTSLRHLDKTDFFTREIDALLLKGECRIAIHSAKDLPEPLPTGLVRIALTTGVDPRDALVLRPGETLHSGARVATSSLRREQQIQALYPAVCCVDIRGTIEARLQLLDRGEFDALVVAEAALIRLGLTHLPRQLLQGPAAPLQGRLAVLSREGDEEMRHLFSCLDA